MRVFALLTLLPSVALGAGANATWTANTEPDLAGYELHYGPTTATYDGDFINATTSPLDIPVSSLSTPAVPDADLIGLPSCTSTFFALAAYDFSGNRSGFGGEVEAVLPATPSALSVTEVSPGSITLSWTGIPANDAGSIDRYLVHYGAVPGGPYDGTGITQGPSPIEQLSAAANPSIALDGLSVVDATHFVVEAVCDVNGASRTSSEVVYNGVVASDGGATADGAPAGDPAAAGDPTMAGDSAETGDNGTAPGDPTPPGGTSEVVGGCSCGAGAAPAFAALALFFRPRRR